MESGGKIPTMIKIKQEVEEVPEASGGTEGYQVFFIKQEVKEEEDSGQDDEVEMQITTGSSSESVGDVSFKNSDEDQGWRLSGDEKEREEMKEQNEREVGNPSFHISNLDSNWQLPGEDKEKNVMRAGKHSTPNNKQSTRNKRKLMADNEKKDKRTNTNPEMKVGNAPCQVSKEGMSSNQRIPRHIIEKGNKRSATNTGSLVGNPVLQNNKEGMRSDQRISGHAIEKVHKTITKGNDQKTCTFEKDDMKGTKPGTQGKILRVDNSTILVLNSGLKLNAELWTRADPSPREGSCHRVNTASCHIPDQGVGSKKHQLNKEEGKVNSVVSHSKFGEMNRGKQTNSDMPVLPQSSQCRPSCSIKSDFPACIKTHIAGNPHPSSDLSSSQTLEKPYQCCHCPKGFSYKYKLIDHKMSVHSAKYKRRHCSQGFNEEAPLAQHVKDHTGDKPFHCSDCDKRFEKKYNLKLHMKTHTGDKPFHCPHCSKRFYRKDGLKEHIRNHTGERPFKCSYCSKSFIRKRNLSDHMNSHTGRSPYKCSICNKGFSSKCNHSKDIILIYPSE